jgi:hypothetical protein
MWLNMGKNSPLILFFQNKKREWSVEETGLHFFISTLVGWIAIMIERGHLKAMKWNRYPKEVYARKDNFLGDLSFPSLLLPKKKHYKMLNSITGHSLNIWNIV